MVIALVRVDKPPSKGEAWTVIDKRERVRFSEHLGPWLLIVPVGRPPEDLAARRVHGIVDKQFKAMPGTPG